MTQANNVAIESSQINSSGILQVAGGGTGLATLTTGYIPYGAGTGALSSSSNLYFDGTNLGIGTTSPQAKLSVSSAGAQGLEILPSTATAIGIQSYNRSTSAYIDQNYVGNTFTWTTGGVGERMRIDSSGNVGIGTSSPQFQLQVINGGLDSRGTGAGIAIRNNSYYSSGDKYLTGSGAASTQYFDGSGNIIFYNTATASTGAGNAVTLSERMRITGNNLLVNYTTSAIYDVNGGTNYASSYPLQVKGSNGSGPSAVAGENSVISYFVGGALNSSSNNIIMGGMYVGASSNTAGSETGYVDLRTKSSGSYAYAGQAMRINSSQDIFMGTTSYIYGSSGGTSALLNMQKSTNASVGILAMLNGAANTKPWSIGPDGNGNYIIFNGSGVGVYIGYGNTGWTAGSDERLKNVIGTYTNALSDITQIKPIKFTWKSDITNTPQVGVIAQSVQEVVPEAVSQSQLVAGDETEYLGVCYTELIPLCIAAIQELSAKVTALETKIAAQTSNSQG